MGGGVVEFHDGIVSRAVHTVNYISRIIEISFAADLRWLSD
jgi:uncharacterized protein YkvS